MAYYECGFVHVLVLAALLLPGFQIGSTFSLLSRLQTDQEANGTTAVYPRTTETTTTEASGEAYDDDEEMEQFQIASQIAQSQLPWLLGNNSAVNTHKLLSEIRNVGATCREECSREDHEYAKTVGHFSRQLQLLQLTVEGLALMLNDALERLEEPNAPKFLKSPYPKDCNEVLQHGYVTSGVYTIHPEGCGPPFHVYCDMETDGGGWTVFQRREDGSVDFERGWGSYRRGFGDVLGEFWLGNDKLHRLSSQDEYELRIDLEAFDGNTSYAKYDTFRTGDVHANYRLHLGKYNGTAGDSLEYHDNLPFTTTDRDNDLATTNCAEVYAGGWWFNQCHYSNLNGRYLSVDTEEFARGIVWYEFHGFWTSLKRAEMKIRSTL